MPGTLSFKQKLLFPQKKKKKRGEGQKKKKRVNRRHRNRERSRVCGTAVDKMK